MSTRSMNHDEPGGLSRVWVNPETQAVYDHVAGIAEIREATTAAMRAIDELAGRVRQYMGDYMVLRPAGVLYDLAAAAIARVDYDQVAAALLDYETGKG